jgi:hypothetical protein
MLPYEILATTFGLIEPVYVTVRDPCNHFRAHKTCLYYRSGDLQQSSPLLCVKSLLRKVTDFFFPHLPGIFLFFKCPVSTLPQITWHICLFYVRRFSLCNHFRAHNPLYLITGSTPQANTPSAACRSFHVIGGSSLFNSTISIAPSTGHTIEHRLQPTQSSSRTFR